MDKTCITQTHITMEIKAHTNNHRQYNSYHGDDWLASKFKNLVVETFTHVVEHCVTLTIPTKHMPNPGSC